MTVFLTNRDGDGKTNEEGHYKFISGAFQGNVQKTGDLLVTQNSPLAMNVLVSEGVYKIETPGDYSYIGWIDGVETVTITAANVSNPRITAIVLYVDKSASTSPSPPNNPGVAKLMAVNGTASGTPVAPNNSVIQAAVGGANPYIKLAEVYVGAGVTQVSNTNITDFRTVIKLSNDSLSAQDMLSAVGPLLYPVGSLYTNATNNSNPATLFGFGTWSLYSQGRVLVGINTGDADFGTIAQTGGAKTVPLTEANLPAHNHNGTTSTSGNHNHKMPIYSGNNGNRGGGDISGANWPSNAVSNYSSTDNGSHNHTFTTNNTGGNQAHNNIQPYITVYIWRRTA